MKQIKIIGERAKYFFKDSFGKTVVEHDTAEDYNDRFINGKKRGQLPQKYGYKYEMAIRATHFDTLDGDIHNGEYAVQGNRIILMVNDQIFNLSKDQVREIKTISSTVLK